MHDRMDSQDLARRRTASTKIRVGITIGTLVALVASLGAPFKWG